MSDKKAERYYTTIPKFVNRVVARKIKRELVGWDYEIRDGHGHLIAWSTRIFKTQDEAMRHAKGTYGDRDPLTRGRQIAQQAFDEKWTPAMLSFVLDKVVEMGYDLREAV